MVIMKTKLGGFRKGSGRKPRTEPKAKPIWCGQGVTPEIRTYIQKWLTPEKRLEILLDAARKSESASNIKCT